VSVVIAVVLVLVCKLSWQCNADDSRVKLIDHYNLYFTSRETHLYGSSYRNDPHD
jgi:hypothetical protein